MENMMKKFNKVWLHFLLVVGSFALILLSSTPALSAWPYIIFPNEEGITLGKGGNVHYPVGKC